MKLSVGDRVRVFDPTLYVDDESTPPSVTMRPATVVGVRSEPGYPELYDVNFDHRGLSRGHFPPIARIDAGYESLETENIQHQHDFQAIADELGILDELPGQERVLERIREIRRESEQNVKAMRDAMRVALELRAVVKAAVAYEKEPAGLYQVQLVEAVRAFNSSDIGKVGE